jgi:hypothetical protein
VQIHALFDKASAASNDVQINTKSAQTEAVEYERQTCMDICTNVEILPRELKSTMYLNLFHSDGDEWIFAGPLEIVEPTG